MSGFALRPATAADHSAVLALNNTEVPRVNALAVDEFAKIVALSIHFTVAEDPEGLLGFVLCIPSGTGYWSGNYQWFGERYARFLYLDRVVVAARRRRGGVGRALYDDLHAQASERWPCIALEVQLLPPNPVSDSFHTAMQYEPVGVRRYDDGGTKAVTMYLRAL